MYHVKRIFQSKPGNTLKVATLAYKASEIYQKEGQRGEFSVYFNGVFSTKMGGHPAWMVPKRTQASKSSHLKRGQVLQSSAARTCLGLVK